jgi:hypothetical protein
MSQLQCLNFDAGWHGARWHFHNPRNALNVDSFSPVLHWLVNMIIRVKKTNRISIPAVQIGDAADGKERIDEHAQPA